MEKAEQALSAMGIVLAKVGEHLGMPNLDPTSGRIFITGGTGVLEHRVACRLLHAGYPTVRLGVTRPDIAQDLGLAGAELADFQWDNDATYENALKDVKSVFCTPPYIEGWDEYFPIFLKACQKAGVKHFVKLSFFHARLDQSVFQCIPFVQANGECDTLLASSRMPYTILAASHFMSNPVLRVYESLRSQNETVTIFGSSHGKGVNYVSPNDVAEVAVRVLLDPKPHFQKEYTLTGPYAVTDEVVASFLSKYFKRQIILVDQPLKVFEEEEKIGGEPSWRVRDLVALELIKNTGVEESLFFVSHDIENLCGRKPESFETYLEMQGKMTQWEMH
jgi:NAD(P)H dehydrogenase (quinone)